MTARFIEYWDPKERSYPMHFGYLGRCVFNSAVHGFAALEVSREWLEDRRVSDALFALERDVCLRDQVLFVALHPVLDSFRRTFSELRIEISGETGTGHALCSGETLQKLQEFCRRGAQYEEIHTASLHVAPRFRGADWIDDPLSAILSDPDNLGAMISQFEDGRRLVMTKAVDRMQGLLQRFLASVPASAADAGGANLQFQLKPGNLRELYPLTRSEEGSFREP